MFELALIDDAVRAMNSAATSIVASANAQPFDNVIAPISLNDPNAAKSYVEVDSSGYIKMDNSEYSFDNQLNDDNAFLECWSEQQVGQMIKTGAVGNKVRKVRLTLLGSNTAAYNSTVSIYSDNGGIPGTVLGTSNAVPLSTFTNKGTVNFTFANEIALLPNTSYWIVLINTGNSSYKVQWFCKMAGIDALRPAAVKTTNWTADATRNMTYALIGYVSTGDIRIGVDLAAALEYQKVYIGADVDGSSSIKVSIYNRDTSALLFDNLENNQTVVINPLSNPRLELKVIFSRDPAGTITLPVLKSVGFMVKSFTSRYQFVDRAFKNSAYGKFTIDPGLKSDSGGLTFGDAASFFGNTDKVVGVLVSSTTCSQEITLNRKALIKSLTFKFSTNNGNCKIKAGIWANNNGVRGTQIAIGVETNVISNTPTDFTLSFAAPVTLEPGTYHFGYSGGYQFSPSSELYLGKGYVDNNNAAQAAAGMYFKVTEIPTYGQAVCNMNLPGINERGLIYAIGYIPPNCSVDIDIYDPVANKLICHADNNQKIDLRLITNQVISLIKVVLTLKRDLNQSAALPSIGLCINYSGSEMEPVLVKSYKIVRYDFGYRSAPGNYLTINGSGRVLAMLIKGSYNSTAPVAFDSHELVFDNGKSRASYAYVSSETSQTIHNLTPLFDFSNVGAAAVPVNFDFYEKLEWNLAAKSTNTNNGGSIVVMVEVNE